MSETGLKVLCSRPWLVVVRFPDGSIVKVSMLRTGEDTYSSTVTVIEGREAVTVRGGVIQVSRGGRPKKFDIADLLRMNRALRLFKRSGDAAVLVRAARAVLGMEVKP